MTRDEIIRMAREAGIGPVYGYESIERFAALVAAHVQQKNQLPITHAEGCWSWGPQHYMCAYNEIGKLRGWRADKN